MAVKKFNKNVSLNLGDLKIVEAIEKKFGTFSNFVNQKISEYKEKK